MERPQHVRPHQAGLTHRHEPRRLTGLRLTRDGLSAAGHEQTEDGFRQTQRLRAESFSASPLLRVELQHLRLYGLLNLQLNATYRLGQNVIEPCTD